MKKHTKESLAALLHGREICKEITPVEESLAKDSGLVVVFGVSDDLIEFSGTIRDDRDCYKGGKFLIDRDGVLPDWNNVDHDDEEEMEKYFARKKGKAFEIDAVWDAEGYSWAYKTSLAHATFDIMDGYDCRYCRGIVFSMEEVQ
jgi:hypothetical protein